MLLDTIRALDVPVFAPTAQLSFKGAGLAGRVATLARQFRRQRLDIVHNYLLRANLVGAVSARLARVPLVLCSKRGCHERRGFELISAKIGNALADRVTVNAEAVREFVHGNEGCARDKMAVIPSGIDIERFRPLPSADFKARLGLSADQAVVGIVTRMRVRKGVEEFIRAMGTVCETNPERSRLIVGEVSFDDGMQALVRDLGLENHLTLLGRRSDMPEVLSAFDVFVLSSHDEGMSNAILEAMAMEKPVVATDVGGTGEVVRHGQSGLLVPPKDPQALAAAIGEVLVAAGACRRNGPARPPDRRGEVLGAGNGAADGADVPGARGGAWCARSAAHRNEDRNEERMNVTYIGHACIMLESGGTHILMDPWLTDPTYHGTWWHYPPLELGVHDLPKIDYLYISHEHPDHFDPPTLRHLDKSIAVIIPNYRRKRFRDRLRAIGFTDIREVNLARTVSL